jgi:hypothetical protein
MKRYVGEKRAIDSVRDLLIGRLSWLLDCRTAANGREYDTSGHNECS